MITNEQFLELCDIVEKSLPPHATALRTRLDDIRKSLADRTTIDRLRRERAAEIAAAERDNIIDKAETDG